MMRLFSKQGSEFVEISSQPLRDELELQRLFEQHSNLIPVPLDPRRCVVREFPTDAGPIDHLAIDAGGDILVLETKLAKNADRRTVIAQAIDYAAQLTKYGPQSLMDVARQRIGEDFTEEWFENLGERNSFLASLERNLRQGRLKVLIVMDRAEDRLKDAVRFMNRATHFSCLLAEIRTAKRGGQELVWVDVYGDESIEDKGDPPLGPPTMDRETFVALHKDTGLESEAVAFLDALDSLVESDADAEISISAVGFYLSPRPTKGYNYLGWYGSTKHLEIWAPAEIYEEVKDNLEALQGPWRARIQTRPLKEGGKFGKVADVEVAGATKEEFLVLFAHYLAARKQGATDDSKG